MTKTIINRLILAVIFIIGSFVLWNQGWEARDRTIDLPFFGQLVLVEDLSGRTGLSAGRFGDLVLFDGDQGRRRQITRDRFYYASPAWSPMGDSLLVESKREGVKYAGLSARSRIYSLTLEGKRITRWCDFFEENYPEMMGRDNVRPSWSPSGNSIGFISHGGRLDGANLIVVRGDTVYTSIRIGRTIPNRIRWSHDDSHLAFEYSTATSGLGVSIQRTVIIVNIETGRMWEATPHVRDGPTSGRGTPICEVGSWSHSSLTLLFTCRELGHLNSTFFSYDVIDREKSEIGAVDTHYAVSPEWNDSENKILYLAADGSLEQDLWIYDLATGAYQQFTEDSRNRRWLSWRWNSPASMTD